MKPFCLPSFLVGLACAFLLAFVLTCCSTSQEPESAPAEVIRILRWRSGPPVHLENEALNGRRVP